MSLRKQQWKWRKKTFYFKDITSSSEKNQQTKTLTTGRNASALTEKDNSNIAGETKERHIMKNLIATFVTTIAMTGITGIASAGSPAFDASFNYEASAPTAQTYAAFTSQAQDICAAEAKRAGYRATESSTWQQRKCAEELVTRAVKATKSESLMAFHKSGGQSVADNNKFASRK